MSESMAENRLTHRIYFVSDLAAPQGIVAGPALAAENLNSLTHMIQWTVTPDSWSQWGGAGTISAAGPWGLLVVSQTDDVHELIRGLMSGIRTIRSRSVLAAEFPNAIPGRGMAERQSLFGPVPPHRGGMTGPACRMRDQTVFLKRYVINEGFSISELTALIVGTIPGRWEPQSATASIFPLGNTLLIRQTPAGHAQIEELLRATSASGSGISELPPGTSY